MTEYSSDASFASAIRGRLESLPISRWHAAVFVICALSLVCDAGDQYIIISIAPLLIREWGATSANIGLIIAATGIGGILGALIFGVLADRVGRRKSLMLAIAIYSILTGLAALARSVPELVAIRTLAGIGLGGIVPVTLAYVAEYSPPKWRGRVVAWWNSMFGFGILASGLVGVFVIVPYGWRWGFAFGTVPLILVAFVYWMPESVRYLVSKGKADEAVRTIERVEKAVLGRDKAAAIAAAHRPNSSPAGAGKAVAPRGQEIAGWRAFKMMTAPGVRGTMIASGVLWFLPSLIILSPFLGVFLTQSKGMVLAAAVAMVTGTSAFGPVGQFIAGFLSDWVGRKATLTLALTFVGTMPVLAFEVANSDSMVFLCLSLSWVGLGGLYGTLNGYTAEQLPTELRAGALGIFEGLRRAGQAVGPAVIGVLYGLLGLTPVVWIAFGGCVLTVVVVHALGRETRGKPMVEMERAI